MAGWRQAIELAMSDEDIAELEAICRSRSEPASRVERARILLVYRKDPSFFAEPRINMLSCQALRADLHAAVELLMEWRQAGDHTR